MAPAPDRVQMRLLAAGQRPVNNVVDASNYVMLELGKPIHTFDARAVHGGRLIVRRARAGERLETLDHVVRELDRETLVIADPNGALAIAGVMGGASSEIGPATTEVIVESAIFDPVSIRRTAFRYGLRSEASLRFEKGQESRLARLGADRAARLIAEWAGGTVAAGRVDTDPVEPAPGRVAFRPNRVERLLGDRVSVDEQRAVLARVGIATEPAPAGAAIAVAGDPRPLVVAAGESAALVAVIPTWRRDLAVEADLIEEIVRVRGYERVPGTLPETPMPRFRPSPLERRQAIRDTLAGAGLSEVVTFALVSPKDAERYPAHDDGAVGGEPDERAGGPVVTVTNPLSSHHSVMRQSLVGGLLEVVATNVRQGRADVAIFEIGKGYAKADGTGAREWWRLGLAITGLADDPAWNRPARAYDLDDLKGIIELLCRRLGLARPIYEPLSDDPNLHPGRAARVRVPVDGSESARVHQVVGRVGEVHPALAERLELQAPPIVVAELAVVGLGGGGLPIIQAVTPSRQPAVARDLAVVVAETRPARDVVQSIERRGGDLLAKVELFDIYRGRPLADGEKSLACRLTFQAGDRTLTEAEIDGAIAEVTQALRSEVGARLRT
ncbi:MAG: phenylalanine--tRNA ligase subunit beta [Chloroflexi bacterium]|nr:phenylalanine--tRNA ligase subunit beta [Chloroflexota bacterium]